MTTQLHHEHVDRFAGEFSREMVGDLDGDGSDDPQFLESDYLF